MFNPANQPHFSLQLPVAHDLQVLEFRGREALSTPFAFEVELVSERPDLSWKRCCTSRRFSPSPRTAAAFTAWSIASRKASPANA